MSNNKLANPLQQLLSTAAKLPSSTGEVAKFQQRLNPSTGSVVILCDISSSMNEIVGSRRKVDMLIDALRQSTITAQPHLIAFNSIAFPIDSLDLLDKVGGSTALHLALKLACNYRPSKTIVISDGRPDNEIAALAAADNLPGIIEVIYCGSEDDADAINFMMRLAARGGGSYIHTGWSQVSNKSALSSTLRTLLALPPGK